MRKSTVKAVAIVIALALIITSFSCVFFLGASFGATDKVTADTPDKDMTAEQMSEILIERLNLLLSYIAFIDANYKDEVDINQLINGAYAGVLSSLNDEFCEYYPTVESKEQFTKIVNNQFTGVGVQIETADGGTKVIRVVKGSPAEEVGLMAGDIFVKIDGKDATKWDHNTCSGYLRGPEGTQVKVTVLRNGKYLDFTITRAPISEASIGSMMIEDSDIGYIEMVQFDSDTADEFESTYENLIQQGAKRFIIDLRGNGGGYTVEAEEIADFILEGCLIDKYETQGNITYNNIARDGHKVDEPIVVLVDRNTASASELLAAALQDNGYKLVGTRTYGKGFAQQIQSLADGKSFKFSTFYFLTPNGNRITREGLTPDVYVPSTTHTDEELLAMQTEYESFAPITLTEKPARGTTSITVYAAQQRLNLLGYKASFSGTMDDATIAAMKAFQSEHGLYAYSVLDYSTQKALEAAVAAELMGASNTAEQLEKAIELVKQY